MKLIVGVLKLLAGIAIIAIFMALPVMWLWNWLMPTIFGLIKIGFWQAFGINLLTGLLFRSSSNK